MGDPKPDVDYGRLVADMPQLRAELEDLEKKEFTELNQLVGFMLIDPVQNRLSVTQAERKQLLQMLKNEFGKTLTLALKGQNYTVNSAQVLYGVLNGDRKAADEK